jgi:hypothetical protein
MIAEVAGRTVSSEESFDIMPAMRQSVFLSIRIFYLLPTVIPYPYNIKLERVFVIMKTHFWEVYWFTTYNTISSPEL